MANIKVELNHEIIDGQPITFVAPCDCTEIAGLKVYHPNGAKTFVFRDAHGNALTGLGNLFSKGAYVKAILDVINGNAYLQNADTNAYLESRVKSTSFENIMVPDWAWEESDDLPLYPYRAAISLPDSGVDASYFVDVVFDQISRDEAELSQDAKSYEGGFYIYAASIPEILVTINTVACIPTGIIQHISEVFGSISVTYAAGATLTCTDGTTTLTAKSTSGKWTFAVPNAGEWTISDGENEHTVNITTQGQSVSVVLSEPWDGTLYDAGNEYTAITGGWVLLGDANKEASALNVICNANSEAGAYTAEKIDLSKYNNLSFTVTDIRTDVMVWVTADKPTSVSSSYSNATEKLQVTSDGTHSFDISAVDSEVYIVCGDYSSSNNSYGAKITKVWLE